ncbi:unnamed protein product [Musa hybrid cultivar]
MFERFSLATSLTSSQNAAIKHQQEGIHIPKRQNAIGLRCPRAEREREREKSAMPNLLPLLVLVQVSLLVAVPDPDTASIQLIAATATATAASTPVTIPASPEQSGVSSAACPLDPPSDLLPSVSAACTASDGGPPSRYSCCPALKAWLLTAYSATALAAHPLPSTGFDLPALPDDSETCIGGVERALRHRGVELPRVNATCDAAYCYCGVRLRRLACAGAFVADVKLGRWVPAGDAGRRLKKDCSRPGFAGCTRCLRTLNQLKAKEKQGGSSNLSIPGKAAAAAHERECQLMGLTWLLSKNRTLFLPTATSVLEALMAAEDADGSHPASCSLSLDEVPLAVRSHQIHGHGGSFAVPPSSLFYLLLLLTLLPIFHV